MSQSAAATISPIRTAISELESEFEFFEPAALDAAIVGLVAGFGDDYGVVCYDRAAVIDILMADGSGRDEAEGFVTHVMASATEDEGPRLLASAATLVAVHNAASIREAINETDGSFMLLEPADMDAAIVGLVSARDKPAVTCYDREMVIDILMRDGMDRDEAEEFFSFNIDGAYMGEATPVYLTSSKTLIDQGDLAN